jgi:hypothetical protein
MIYDAIGGGMATITITFKLGHEIHQPLRFCRLHTGKHAQGVLLICNAKRLRT